MSQLQSNLHSSQTGLIPTFLPKSTSAHPAEADAQIPAQLRTPAKISLERDALLWLLQPLTFLLKTRAHELLLVLVQIWLSGICHPKGSWVERRQEGTLLCAGLHGFSKSVICPSECECACKNGCEQTDSLIQRIVPLGSSKEKV